MRLLNVLTVGLLMALPSLWGQPSFYGEDVQYYDATVDVWIQASPADGSWEAGGDTLFPGTYGCELCSTDAYVAVEIDEDGFYLTSDSYDDPNGNASLTYVARDPNTGTPTLIDLAAIYDVYGNHSWGDGSGAQTFCSITVPDFPSAIVLTGIDATDPGNVQVYFSTSPSPPSGQFYSSTVSLGGESSISYSQSNPVFSFSEGGFEILTNYPITTPLIFQGYLAGHYMEGPTGCYVTTNGGVPVTSSFSWVFQEGGEITGRVGPPAPLLTVHTGVENMATYDYCPNILAPYSKTRDVAYALGSIDTHANPCHMMGGSECDISEIVEINMTPVSSDVLPIVAPGPWIPSGADSTNFWVAQLYYYGFWWWNGTPFSVCNSNVSVWAVGSANSVLLGHMGCQSLPLP